MAKARKMTPINRKGTHLEKLKALAAVLAAQIDNCVETNSEKSLQTLSQLSKQYRETILQIANLEGGEVEDDEIGEILSTRKADGKSNSVR